MSRGLILGKFMPPHRGHQYLIDFARRMVDDLTVQVCSIQREPIPGALRYQWVRDHFGGVNVVHNADENPQAPEDDPEHFWEIWRESLLKRMPGPPDLVFASEAYGLRLAQELGAAFVPVDPLREIVPTSASDIRRGPMQHWDYLLPEARPYFIRRIVIVGPESSGKSTLAKSLAQHFDTRFVAEYGRTYQENIGRELVLSDLERIVIGHRASEDAVSLQANRLLIVDTEAIVTRLWSLHFCGEVPAKVEEYICDARYALYLLCTPHETEWYQDGWRVHPDRAERLEFFNRIRQPLDALNRPYVVLEGDWEARQRQAISAVQAVLEQ